jgi:signal transduction histidine kinase
MTDPPDNTTGCHDAARQRFSELTQLISGLAHEMKNPLSTIGLNLRLLGEDIARYGDDEHQRLARRVERVQGETERVRQILEDFLRFAGKVELEPIPADLVEVVSQLCDFFGPQAESNRVVLRSSLPDQAVIVRMDVKLIKQALLNLMINATQAMPSGGELLLRVSDCDGQVMIEVIDTGPGIPPDVLEKIFQPYWTDKEGGSGLGLPTARRIICEHGGSMRVDSEPGKGTRMFITLPKDGPPTGGQGQ